MMIAHILVAFIGLLHLYILILEMFLWDQPRGLKAFGHNLEKAKMTKILAQNQGLYNGFLAVGLFWSLLADASLFIMLANFFLGCVLIAGIFGAYTASRKILFIQAIPALIALIFVNMGW